MYGHANALLHPSWGSADHWLGRPQATTEAEEKVRASRLALTLERPVHAQAGLREALFPAGSRTLGS
jgi:hypothetical protein